MTHTSGPPPPGPTLTVRGLNAPTFAAGQEPLWAGVDLTVEPDSIVVVRAPSGAGKTVLLKCIAELLVYDEGEINLWGQSAREIGISHWRSHILYLPQRPALLPGTPTEFFATLSNFSCRKKIKHELLDPVQVAQEWGIAPPLFSQTWGSLSGGEAQRIALAIALSLKPTLLLLDEPTSALDSVTAGLVEKTLVGRRGDGTRQACLWITHSDEQAGRVATDTFNLAKFMSIPPV